jgi:Mg2+-importing ATPase
MTRHPVTKPRLKPALSPAGESLGAAFARLNASPAGLDDVSAAAQLRRSGPNALKPAALALPLQVALAQLSSPFVLVLIVAAGLSFVVGEPDEAIIIIAIVAMGAVLGFFQEFRAARAVAALSARLAGRSVVRRSGETAVRDPATLVPGDIVVLSGGSLIPADGVLIAANALHADEAALTGEAFPAAKEAAPATGPMPATARVFMGTSVRSGSGEMLVLETGARTHYGHIATLSAATEPDTAFAQGIRRFGFIMMRVMIVITFVVLPINLLSGRPVLDSLLFAAALAVGLTPELLPAIVTITLARGARRLAKFGVLVKRLVAIENLGAMDVLCTDKTGTLTEGTLTLVQSTRGDGVPDPEVGRLAMLNALLQSGLGNPLDDALQAAADPLLVRPDKLGEVPYDFERKRLSVAIAAPEGPQLITKGAVSAMLAVATQIVTASGVVAVTPALRALEDARLAQWSDEGYRVIAVATRPLAAPRAPTLADESDMVLRGYLLFADPIKPGVADTVALLNARGIQLKLITGDNRHAALHVARLAGLTDAKVMDGEALMRLTPRALARAVLRHQVFAEVTPDLKEALVAALRKSGDVVGFLGDGINDAPALRAADLGISVDSAVDAAREAADVVLLKRDLSVLLEGVLAGRQSFANTLKYISITTSANLGNMISMALASLFLPFLPLLAKQILVNNFLSDLPLMAVSTDRVDDAVLEGPGRWDFRRLVRGMIGFGLVSSLFDGLTMGLLLYLHEGAEPLFQTGWFLESLLTEIAIVFVMRTRKSAFSSRPGGLLVALSVAVAALAVALPYLPIARIIGLEPLPLTTLVLVTGIVVAYAGATDLVKRRLLR